MDISKINLRLAGLAEAGSKSSSESGIESFKDLLSDKLSEVNQMQINSENATEDFINGEDIDIHQVMLAAEEAKMSIEMAVQVRNKIVEAYQEMNRMQI